jgi:hypothetical protein
MLGAGRDFFVLENEMEDCSSSEASALTRKDAWEDDYAQISRVWHVAQACSSKQRAPCTHRPMAPQRCMPPLLLFDNEPLKPFEEPQKPFKTHCHLKEKKKTKTK